MQSDKVDTHKTLLWSMIALIAGHLGGFLLFSPTLTFIVPEGYTLQAIEPGEQTAVKMQFVLLWALLFVLIHVLNRNIKRKMPNHLPLLFMSSAALIGALLCVLYVKSQIAFFGYPTQTPDMPAYVLSLKSTRIEWIPAAGIAAAFIIFGILKHFSQHKQDTTLLPNSQDGL